MRVVKLSPTISRVYKKHPTLNMFGKRTVTVLVATVFTDALSCIAPTIKPEDML